jgi:hypothetical protein
VQIAAWVACSEKVDEIVAVGDEMDVEGQVCCGMALDGLGDLNHSA